MSQNTVYRLPSRVPHQGTRWDFGDRAFRPKTIGRKRIRRRFKSLALPPVFAPTNLPPQAL